MKKILLAFSMMALAGGCGGNDMDEAVNKMGSFADKLCKCKDVACAEGVKKEMDAYGESVEKKFKGKEPSKAQIEKMMKSMGKIQECMEKLKPADAPAPTP